MCVGVGEGGGVCDKKKSQHILNITPHAHARIQIVTHAHIVAQNLQYRSLILAV